MRKARTLQPGDVIFGDELVLGVMPATMTPLGQNVLIATDKDTFRVLADELV
jgi:hypothetical protein